MSAVLSVITGFVISDHVHLSRKRGYNGHCTTISYTAGKEFVSDERRLFKMW